MRLTDYEVVQILGCDPCICGDLTTWHPQCYAGKTDAEIQSAARAAMRRARRAIKRKAAVAARDVCEYRLK